MAQLHGADRFRIDRELADTLQGRIYAGVDRMTNKPAVIKEAWRQLVSSGYSRKGHRVPEDFISERRMIMRLSQMADCQGIAKGIGQWDDEHCHYYAMEHCEAELFDFISKHHQSARYRQFVEAEARKQQVAVTEPTEWTQKVASMFKQICSAVHWMHSKGFCHLDLSLENTMISDLANLKVKIIDLGLTKEFPDGNFLCRLGRVGKLQYMCPEAYARRPFDARKADVYCLGVMLFMMLIGAPPYQAPQPQNAAFRYIVGGKIADVLKHWKRLRLLTEDAVDLLTKMLCYEQHRISMADILNHPFLADIGTDEVEDEKSATDVPSSVMMMNETPNPMGQIEQKVSNMSIDDDSHGVNSQKEKPSMNAMDQKDESNGDQDHNRHDNGRGGGNLADFQCETLLQRWRLMHCYDALVATDWAKPAEWHELTVSVLRFEAGLEEGDANRFMECMNAQFGGGQNANAPQQPAADMNVNAANVGHDGYRQGHYQGQRVPDNGGYQQGYYQGQRVPHYANDDHYTQQFVLHHDY